MDRACADLDGRPPMAQKISAAPTHCSPIELVPSMCGGLNSVDAPTPGSHRVQATAKSTLRCLERIAWSRVCWLLFLEIGSSLSDPISLSARPANLQLNLRA